jgi:hypothetical protein
MASRILTLICIFCLAAVVLPASAEEYDPAASAEAWAAAAEPGPVHALLATRAGDWALSAKSWMVPGADPILSESVGCGEMILGDRFLDESVVGTTMGMEFEGRGLTGYDITTHLVTSIWMDTMGTVMVVMTGIYEKPGEPMELFGEMVDPGSGLIIKVRTVTTFIDDDTHTMDYYMTVAGGEETKAMELSYKRK